MILCGYFLCFSGGCMCTLCDMIMCCLSIFRWLAVAWSPY